MLARRSVQNREVYTVPGDITSRNSFGTNYLINGAGAKLVQQWQDGRVRPIRPLLFSTPSDSKRRA